MATSFINAEPSAFGAGDINSANPYGLTESEKQLLDVKKRVENVDVRVKTMNNQINTINEQIDGMRSVFDGLNSKVQNINFSENSDALNNLILELQELKKYTEQSNENIKKTLVELTTNIEKNYVLKTSFTTLEQRVLALENKKVSTTNASPITITTATPNALAFTNMDNAAILKKGEELFAAKKHDEAKPYFEHLLSKNHRPARSSFILGEIEYSKENYSSAISYYKKSAELSSDTNWMPKLMYHTAISFDKINDKNSADQFYRALKATFPDSEEAKVSPNR